MEDDASHDFMVCPWNKECLDINTIKPTVIDIERAGSTVDASTVVTLPSARRLDSMYP